MVKHVLVGLCLAFCTAPHFAAEPPKAGDAAKKVEQVDMAAMMANAQKYITPGPEHELLKRFLGDWDTETKFVMPGAPDKPEKGGCRGRWMVEGRWLSVECEGTMMGMPIRMFHTLGYDRFKMSYVTSTVSSFDTAMTHSEGDVDPKTGSIVSYGTLDEYLTGEHDKMVKYAWRFPDDKTIRLEIHDLPIGETGAQVLEITYRKKAGGAK
jgi:Protein of unknown function (DUF1579)